MSIKIPSVSRLQSAKLFKEDNVLFWENRLKITPNYRADDRFHTVIDLDRITLLANVYLGDPELWWVIADYNDLFFCDELDIGAVLRIPELSTIQLEILS